MDLWGAANKKSGSVQWRGPVCGRRCQAGEQVNKGHTLGAEQHIRTLSRNTFRVRSL